MNRILFLLISIFTVQGSTVLNAGAETQNEIRFSPEQLVDLAFKDCPELLQYLSTPHVQASQYEKFQIGEALTRILELESPNIPSGMQASSILYDTYFPSDISRVLEPDRENEAKLCTLRALTMIAPQSIAFTPVLFKLTLRKTISGNIRLEALDTADKILSTVSSPLDDESRQILLRQIQKHSGILSDPISISLLAYLARYHLQDLLKLMSKDHRITPVAMKAIAGTDPDGTRSIPLLKDSSTLWDETGISLIIKHLSLFSAEAAPHIIEFIGEVLGNFSAGKSNKIRKEIFSILNILTSKPSTFSDYYLEHNLEEDILNQYLSLLQTENKSNKIIIFKLLSKIQIPSEYQICSNDEAELRSPLLTEAPGSEYLHSLLTHLMCPLSAEKKKEMLTWLETEDNYAKTTIAISALGHHTAIDQQAVSALRKLLAKLAKDKKNKELEHLSALSFFYISQSAFDKHFNQLLPFAIEHLQTSGELPPIFRETITDSIHPGMLFFLAHGRHTTAQLGELLDHKSALVRLRAASILSSPEIPYTPSHTAYFIKLLDDPEIELQNIAFETLKKQVKEADLKLFVKNLKNENSLKKFYSTNIIFDRFIHDTESDLTKKLDSQFSVKEIFQQYASVLPEIPCSIKAKQIPDAVFSKISDQTFALQSEIVKSHLTCAAFSTDHFEQVARLLTHIKKKSPHVIELFFKQVKKRKYYLANTTLFDLTADILTGTSEISHEFIEFLLHHTKNAESIYLYQWLQKNRRYTNDNKEVIEKLLKNTYPNKSTNELNKLFLKLFLGDSNPESWYPDLKKQKLNEDSLRDFLKLIPESELRSLITSLGNHERPDHYYISFKSHVCTLAPFEDNCKVLFNEMKSVLLDHPSMLLSALLFQADRYLDYETCDAEHQLNLISCEERREAILGEAVLLLEKLLLSGSWLQSTPNQDTKKLSVLLDILTASDAPYHLQVLSKLFRIKLLDDSTINL